MDGKPRGVVLAGDEALHFLGHNDWLNDPRLLSIDWANKTITVEAESYRAWRDSQSTSASEGPT